MFFYGESPLPDELSLFDVVVIDPGAAHDLKNRTFDVEAIYGYVSLGEVRKDDPRAAELDMHWIKSANEAWATHAMDQTAPGWRQFFIERVVAPLREKGIRNIFIDTMDSYQLFAKTPEERVVQEAGMVETIRAVKAKYPDMRIILNRGFEVIEPLRDVVDAMAVESLFRGWRQAEQSYREVSESDRTWILGQIRRVRDAFGIPVIVIDYVAPGERDLARETVKKISDLGFIPCVTNGSLTMLGISTVEPLPRKILFLHDGMQVTDYSYYDAARFGAMPLNYLGYVPEYLDVSATFPSAPLNGRYAGIVAWFETSPKKQRELARWLLQQKQDGIPLVFVGNFGVSSDSPLMGDLGFSGRPAAGQSTKVSIASVDASIMGFEMPPLPVPDSFFPLVQKERDAVLLDLSDERGSHMHAAAITSWGGYVLTPFVVREMGASNVYRWVVNPLLFFKKALKLPDLPVPDVTTHNGRRMLMVHIDGDGVVSRAEFGGNALAGRVMLDEILRKYRIPTTVSVIEGETSVNGLYPDLSAAAERIYREIFSLSHIEPASHSFSHPFYWSKAAKNTDEASYHLKIPGYIFDVRRETLGSLDYVNRLTPAGKKARVFLWTGDCNPDVDALSLLDGAGIPSMNGGDTVITRENPSWTAIGPIGLQKGPVFQVYAPNQNENMYTELWTKRFYGYERAVETFQLTDLPYRFKPINIYYHMYSATKPASLQALKKVYEYALKQDVVAVYSSEYIRKAYEFNRVAVGKTAQGFVIAGARDIRQLRIPVAMGYPSSVSERGVYGFTDHGQSRYLHLDGSGKNLFALQKERLGGLYLDSVNADIRDWRSLDRGMDIGLVSHQQTVKLRLGNASGCSVKVNGALRRTRMIGPGIAEVEMQGKEDVLQTISIRCAH